MGNKNMFKSALVWVLIIGALSGLIISLRYVNFAASNLSLEFENLSVNKVFLNTFLVNLPWIVIVLLIGIKSYTLIFAFPIVYIKGYLIGFSFIYLIKSFGIGLFFKGILGMTLPNILLAFVMILCFSFYYEKFYTHKQISAFPLYSITAYVFVCILQSYLQYILFYKLS